MAARRKPAEAAPTPTDDDFFEDEPTPITDVKASAPSTPPVPPRDLSGMTIQEKLLVPFPEEDISVGDDGFDYVDPEKYRARLHEIFPHGYTFEAVVDKIVKLDEENLFGLEGKGYFQVYVDAEHGGPFQATITRTVFEEFIIGASQPTATWKGNLGEVLKAPQTYSMFASAALKAVATELGIGQHLYHKEAKKSEKGMAKRGRKPAASTTAQAASNAPASTSTPPATSNASAASTAPAWDGSEIVKFGAAYKGMAYRDIPNDDKGNGWLTRMATKTFPTDPADPYYKADKAGQLNADKGSMMELDRRRAASTAQATASAAASVGSGDQIPF